MNPFHTRTRRHFFHDCGVGLGKIALASLASGALSSRASAASGGGSPLAPQATHFPATVRRVIYLFMAGAPSQLDLFDYKPKLVELEGKPIPPSVIAGQRYAFIQPDAAGSSPPARISARRENCPRTPNCWTGWRSSS